MLAACGDEDAGEPPFAPEVMALTVDETQVLPGLSEDVRVVYDGFGVPHIYAQTERDMFFMQGYQHALQRWPQLELGRRTAAGTLATLIGGAEPGAVDDDKRLRILGIPAAGRGEWEVTDAADGRGESTLRAYAAGVNRFLAQWRAGEQELAQGIDLIFDRDRVEDWKPEDSVILARYVAFLLQYDGRAEVEITDVWQKYNDTLSVALWQDLAGWRPAVEVSHIDGFPNLETDTGSRAKARRAVKRPVVSQGALAAAAEFLGDRSGASNSWVVHGSKTVDGAPLLASDPHAALDSPASFWVVHLNMPASGSQDGRALSLHGIQAPGLPSVFSGFNERLAWATTTASYDYTDVYLEQVTPGADGGPGTVSHLGQDKPIERITETVGIGLAGQINLTEELVYDVVPHHGPIVPPGEDSGLVDGVQERLSVRWVAGRPERSVLGFLSLAFAHDVAEAEDALNDFQAGGANWTVITAGGDIFYSGSSFIPVRPDECMQFHPVRNPDAIAPFFVQPGTGECDWVGGLDDRYIPHAVNPAKGYVVTANEDQTGATFDNDPLNDGKFGGYDYVSGFRGGRITELVEAGGDQHTMATMSAIQHDTQSGVGRRATPFALGVVDAAKAGEHGLGPAVAALGDEFARIERLADMLRSWDFETDPERAETAIHSAWFSHLLAQAIGDENREAGRGRGSSTTVPALLRMLEKPDTLEATVPTPDGGVDSAAWDDLGTPDVVETRWDILLRAWQLALPALDGMFGDPDPTTWKWGDVHRKEMNSPLSNLPLATDLSFDLTPAGGVPRSGDWANINVCNGGITSPSGRCGGGPVQRLVVQMNADTGPKATLEFPGGQEFDPASPHFNDQLVHWLAHEPQPVHFTPAEVAAAKARVVVYTP